MLASHHLVTSARPAIPDPGQRRSPRAVPPTPPASVTILLIISDLVPSVSPEGFHLGRKGQEEKLSP